MKVTVELQPSPPTKKFEDEFNYAVLFGDSSGLIAVVRDERWAQTIARILNCHKDFSGYNTFIVRKVVKKELT